LIGLVLGGNLPPIKILSTIKLIIFFEDQSYHTFLVLSSKKIIYLFLSKRQLLLANTA
jgi:hypothetical protein